MEIDLLSIPAEKKRKEKARTQEGEIIKGYTGWDFLHVKIIIIVIGSRDWFSARLFVT